MVWWEYILWYGIWIIWYVWFVVLKAFRLREEDLWDLWSRGHLYIGFEVCEVHGWFFAEVDSDN